MTVFLQFLADNAQFVYFAVILVALYLLRRALITRRERRSALFPLEREVAMSRTYRIIGAAIFLLIIIGGVWAAGQLLLPRLQTVEGIATPTPDLLVLLDTPTPTLPPPTATPTITPTAKPRPTRKPPPVEEASTPTPVIQPPSCPNPAAAISSPGNGQIADGELAVTGTASIDGFQFYKLEWAADANPQQWNWFAGSEHPVVGSVLGSFNPAGLPSGTYQIRLVVVDNTGNYPQPCNVQVVIP